MLSNKLAMLPINKMPYAHRLYRTMTQENNQPVHMLNTSANRVVSLVRTRDKISCHKSHFRIVLSSCLSATDMTKT